MKKVVAAAANFLGALLLFALITASACAEKAPVEDKPKPIEGTVIARVGNSVLTLEELRASIPSEYFDAITREQNIQYVRQWINTELLFREALRLEIDRDPETHARLEKMKRDLLSSEVINRALAGQGSLVTEDQIRDYYEVNRASFVRETFTVRYDRIFVEDLTLAWEIRRTATHENFRELKQQHSKLPPIPTFGDVTPYVPLDQLTPVERNAVMGANTPSITGPYRAENGFYVIRLLGRFDRGTIASLDEMRGEIMARLSMQAQRALIDRLVEDIRSREEVEFHVDLIGGAGSDTTATEVVEVQ